jgi:ABC-type iron transport system FetAB ATPase subunit
VTSGGLPPDAADKRVSTYSKGMRQKVGIAIAVAKRAEALLLDEPTSGLDPKAANEFSQLLTTLSGSGVAVLMATHEDVRHRRSHRSEGHRGARRAARGDPPPGNRVRLLARRGPQLAWNVKRARCVTRTFTPWLVAGS